MKIQSDKMGEKFGNSFCFTTEAFITVILLKKVLICCQHLGFLSFSGKALKNDSRHNVKRDFVKKNDPLQKFCQNLNQAFYSLTQLLYPFMHIQYFSFSPIRLSGPQAHNLELSLGFPILDSRPIPRVLSIR